MARKGTESYKIERRQKKKHKSKVLFALREIEKKMLCAGNEDIRNAFSLPNPTFNHDMNEMHREEVKVKLEEQNRDGFATYLSLLKDRMLHRMRYFGVIAEDQMIPAKDRISAERMRVDAVIDILKLESERFSLAQGKKSKILKMTLKTQRRMTSCWSMYFLHLKRALLHPSVSSVQLNLVPI
jgi:hypothetical protein